MSIADTAPTKRATFAQISPEPDVRPTERELSWLRHLARHGPQSSTLLLEHTADTHRCRDTGLRALQRLRAGGYLRLPPQQRNIARAEFQPYIYDLTRQAEDYLKGCGQAEPTVRPQGHWWHNYATATCTGALDIAARKQDIEYIPAHHILAINEATLGIPLARGRLIPDQLFGLKYENGYRAFFLEVDRGTEPITGPANRRSLTRAIDNYAEVFAGDLHHRHYGHSATTLLLFVFNNPSRMQRFVELVATRAPALAKRTLANTSSPATALADQTLPWRRASGGIVDFWHVKATVMGSSNN